MSARFLVFDEARLREILERVRAIVERRDATAWRDFWAEHGSRVAQWGEPPQPTDDGVPSQEPAALRTLLRTVAHGVALRRVFLEERLWHVHYPDLSDDDAGFEISESPEYEAVGLNVFTTSAMPAGLESLNEGPDVSTNWVSSTTVKRLWAMEVEEGMLAAVGRNLAANAMPLGRDLLALRELLEWTSEGSNALYLWAPGS